MATFLTYLGTPRDPSIKEDLLDLITNIDPVNNYLVSNLGTSEAKSVYHEWLEDNLPATTPGTPVARAENFTPSWGNASGIARRANYTQIISSEFQVSRSQQLVEKAGIESRIAYEQDRAMKHWTNEAENALMHATLASGTASSPTRRMQGVKWFASLTSSISGVSLNETIFNNLMQDAWSKGETWDTVILPANLKTRVDGFTAGTTKYTDATAKKLVNMVNIYESSWGVVKLIPSRMALTGEMLFLSTPRVKVAYLDNPHFEDYAKTTDGTNGLIVGELTAEVLSGYAAGFYRNLL